MMLQAARSTRDPPRNLRRASKPRASWPPGPALWEGGLGMGLLGRSQGSPRTVAARGGSSAGVVTAE